jgi:hypothetical protein
MSPRLSERSRFVGATALLAILVAGGTRPAAGQGTPALLLRVVDSASGAPIPNADVLAATRHGLTDAKGELRIAWPADGKLAIRVRQLGFAFVERTLARDAAATPARDTVVVAMRRAAFALPQVTTVATVRCREIPNDAQRALSRSGMEILRFGAEQYGAFRRRYPFRLTLERRTERTDPSRRGGVKERTAEETTSEAWGDSYFPGRVLQQTGILSWVVPLLFVSALADSAFLERHCFLARGVETRAGRRVIRLDFSPSLGIRDPEWEGAVWLDSAASVLRRVEFRLANLRDASGPRSFEGYTVFTTPSPYIARPDTTVARWTTFGAPSGAYGLSASTGGSGTQTLTIGGVEYVKEEPPGLQ